MLIDIALVLVLAALSGFFALSEMALMTSRRNRIKHLGRDSRRSEIALALMAQPERFLATVQVFITLLSIATGAALGASIGAEIADALIALDIAWLAPYSVPLGVALSVAAITFANMLIAELLPKRIALVNPEHIAIAVAVPMHAMVTIAAPFSFVLIGLTRLLLRLMRLDRVSREQVSEDEIRLLVAEGAEQGVIDSDERNMVNRVLRLGDRSVDSLMTPRTRVTWLDADAAVEKNLATMRATPYSRYPVLRGGEHDILGILEVKRLIGDIGSRTAPELFRTLRKPLFVPATARALDLLEEFRDAETPLALVVDEYGDIEGLVSLNDLLGAVVGRNSAAPRDDTHEPPICQRDDGSWLVDASLGVDDLREFFGLTELPNEQEHDFHTVAGMITAQFGRIPRPGEHFQWGGFRFEVVDLDGARIDKVLIATVEDAADRD